MTQPDLFVPEVKRPGPFFHDQGRYTLLTNQNVESGKFEVDTCPAEQMGNFKDWESLIHLSPDNAILPKMTVKHSFQKPIPQEAKHFDYGRINLTQQASTQS